MKTALTSVALMLLLATLGWGILLRDLYISCAYSNSFSLLDEHSTLFVFWGAIGLCLLAAIVLSYNIFKYRNQNRLAVLLLLILSIALSPLALACGNYIATTQPAILKK